VDRCEQEKRDETTNGKQSFHGAWSRRFRSAAALVK
jgi:hypothetical protein